MEQIAKFAAHLVISPHNGEALQRPLSGRSAGVWRSPWLCVIMSARGRQYPSEFLLLLCEPGPPLIMFATFLLNGRLLRIENLDWSGDTSGDFPPILNVVAEPTG
jgi:hypothetical protein